MRGLLEKRMSPVCTERYIWVHPCSFANAESSRRAERTRPLPSIEDHDDLIFFRFRL